MSLPMVINRISAPFPILQLPPEIIGEIFYRACEDYRASVHKSMTVVRKAWTFDNPHKRHRYTVTPGALSLVCRAWRDITYSTPMLWDTVWVDHHMPHYRQQWGSASLEASMKLKKWLRRAGSIPLTIKVEELADGGSGSIITELMLYSGQWKDIDIYCPSEDSKAYSGLQAVMRQPLPLLEAFTCRPSLQWTLSSRRRPPFSIPNIPSLTSITLFRDFPTSISCCGITACKWAEIDCAVIRDHLREMGSLKTCSIYSATCVKAQDSTLHTMPSSLLLPHVENFSLSASQPNAFDYIMQSLSLPELRWAYFSSYEDDALLITPIIAHIVALLQRSNYPALQTLNLDISVPQFNMDPLLELLQVIPALEKFKFTLGVYGDEIENELVRSSVIQEKPKSFIVLELLTAFTLDISSLSDEDQVPLLGNLTLPALQELDILFPMKSSGEPLLSDLRSLLSRSSSSLRSLKLMAKTDISEGALLELLKMLPTLESLHILGSRVCYNQTYFGIYDDTESKLATRQSWFELLLPVSQGCSVYLPALQEISFEGILMATSDVIFNALEYRWRGDNTVGITKLLSARIFAKGCGGELTNCAAAITRLAALSSEGMDVVFADPV